MTNTTDNLKFETLSLSPEVLRAVQEMGFVDATPIQAQAIPYVLEGRDIIGQAMTGTGKTAAFGIPLAEKIDSRDRNVQALILCPTRELAIQVSVEMTKILKYKKGVSVVAIYGGQPIEKQFAALRRGAQVIVGTPGRLMDHMGRKSISITDVKTVVLDEADQMLDMGFRDDMEMILEQTRPERQTVLFSATMSREILNLAKRYQTNPHMVKIAQEEATVPSVEQIYFEVEGKLKTELLARLVELHEPKSSIVFCNTKRRVDEVVSSLAARGYAADGIHGDISQAKRDRVMDKFRRGGIGILVATDVAARGIDVPSVEAVFNLEIPRDSESYVHRIGRTGRAGRGGKAFSFVSGPEQFDFRAIRRYTNATMAQHPIPLLERIENIKAHKVLIDIQKIVQGGKLEKYIGMLQPLVEQDHTPIDVAAALMKMVAGKNEPHKEDLLASMKPQLASEGSGSFSSRRGGFRGRPRSSNSRTSSRGGNWGGRGDARRTRDR